MSVKEVLYFKCKDCIRCEQITFPYPKNAYYCVAGFSNDGISCKQKILKEQNPPTGV